MQLSKWSGLFPIALLATLAGCGSKGTQQVAAQGPPPTVEITQVAPSDADIFAEYPAQTYARNMVEVRGRVDGYIEKWLFRPGQQVKAGQPLYILDLRPYRGQVQQAQGNVQQTEADLSFAQQPGLAAAGGGEPRRRASQPGESAAGLRTPEAAGGAGCRGQAGSGRRGRRAARRRSRRPRQPGECGTDAAHHAKRRFSPPKAKCRRSAARSRPRQLERAVRHHHARRSAA